MNTGEIARLTYKEELMVEDWIGDNSDERQARGDPPDEVKTFVHYYEKGVEVTDAEGIARVEAKLKESN